MGANDIAIVEDIEDFRIGDYLGAKPCLIQGLSHQHPALKSSVRPNKPEERSKVISALNTLWIEDPSLSFSINSYSDELEISLYGLTQKEIIQTLLEERFSVKVHFDEIKTIYKERPIKKVNKIIQIEVPPNPYWATIGLTLEPLPLGAGLQIESDISYGYLNHSFQNAVFEGIRMSCQSGLHGWEVTDLKVTFTQAEYYSPVSTPADFRQLTPYVFRLALQQSGVDILEPMLCFELQIPQVASSKAITDLQKLMSEIEDISCNNEWCHIKGKDVTSLIRQQQINDNVSTIASYKGVRQYLVERQQEMAAVGGVILDGRDIGSVVLPNAELKIYLTASVDARAKRRWLEVQGTSNEQTLDEIKKNVVSRDEMDKNREESPLVCVEDAVVVDSSNMNFDETVAYILNLVQETINHE